MKKNVGSIDRMVRGTLGVVACGAAGLGLVSGGLAIAALVVGLVLVATAALGWCPPYTLLGINTCRVRNRS